MTRCLFLVSSAFMILVTGCSDKLDPIPSTRIQVSSGLIQGLGGPSVVFGTDRPGDPNAGNAFATALTSNQGSVRIDIPPGVEWTFYAIGWDDATLNNPKCGVATFAPDTEQQDNEVILNVTAADCATPAFSGFGAAPNTLKIVGCHQFNETISTAAVETCDTNSNLTDQINLYDIGRYVSYRIVFNGYTKGAVAAQTDPLISNCFEGNLSSSYVDTGQVPVGGEVETAMSVQILMYEKFSCQGEAELAFFPRGLSQENSNFFAPFMVQNVAGHSVLYLATEGFGSRSSLFKDHVPTVHCDSGSTTPDSCNWTDVAGSSNLDYVRRSLFNLFGSGVVFADESDSAGDSREFGEVQEIRSDMINAGLALRTVGFTDCDSLPIGGAYTLTNEEGDSVDIFIDSAENFVPSDIEGSGTPFEKRVTMYFDNGIDMEINAFEVRCTADIPTATAWARLSGYDSSGNQHEIEGFWGQSPSVANSSFFDFFLSRSYSGTFQKSFLRASLDTTTSTYQFWVASILDQSGSVSTVLMKGAHDRATSNYVYVESDFTLNETDATTFDQAFSSGDECYDNTSEGIVTVGLCTGLTIGSNLIHSSLFNSGSAPVTLDYLNAQLDADFSGL